jgi:hypothetical protein
VAAAARSASKRDRARDEASRHVTGVYTYSARCVAIRRSGLNQLATSAGPRFRNASPGMLLVGGAGPSRISWLVPGRTRARPLASVARRLSRLRLPSGSPSARCDCRLPVMAGAPWRARM